VQALMGIIRTMRPKQWTKNVLFVFPALIFDGQLTHLDAVFRVSIACMLLILMSGTVYLINDIVDVEKDKLHPKKKFRPIPSGILPIRLAIVVSIILPALTLSFAFVWDWSLAIVLVFYLVIQVGYSFYFKHIPILDVMVVTSGFILRVLAGVVVIDVKNFSPWLYACTGLLALFLVVGKRRQELVTLGDNAKLTRPIFVHYNLPLLDDMLRMIMTSTFLAYLLYTIEVNVTKIANINPALLTVPPVLYGLFRYMYLIHIKGEGSAPDEVLLTDRPLQIAILVWGLIVIVLLYLI
jgi:4-hydroxybenzoate polyprenyltransferase